VEWGFAIDVPAPLVVRATMKGEDFDVFWVIDRDTRVLGMYLGGYPKFDRNAPRVEVGAARGQCERKASARSCLFSVRGRPDAFAPLLHVWTETSSPAVLAQADAILATLHVE
jgi:hypothetical protein